MLKTGDLKGKEKIPLEYFTIIGCLPYSSICSTDKCKYIAVSNTNRNLVHISIGK